MLAAIFVFIIAGIKIVDQSEGGFFKKASSEKKAVMAASNGKTKQNKNSKKKSVVYMTTDISAEGLVKIYEKPGWKPKGKVAVKV